MRDWGRVRIYASAQNHSSVLKACRIAGIGDAGLVNVAVREDLGMDPAALQMAIEADKAAGLIPAGVVILYRRYICRGDGPRWPR